MFSFKNNILIFGFLLAVLACEDKSVVVADKVPKVALINKATPKQHIEGFVWEQGFKGVYSVKLNSVK